MSKPTKTYMLMQMDPPAAIQLIKETYAKHANWAAAAAELEISVPMLRIHARQLGFKPGKRHAAKPATAKAPPKAQKRAPKRRRTTT